MNQLQYDVVKDGIFLPSGLVSAHDIVYDAEYRLVDTSCLKRGKDNVINVTEAPEYLPAKARRRLERQVAPREHEKLLFLGTFAEKHYGHLLTEGISRYWFRMEYPEYEARIPTPINPFGFRWQAQCSLKPQYCHWKAFLNVFTIGPEDIRLSHSPLRASEIVVPHPSMINRGRIFPAHLAVTKRVAQQFLHPSEISRRTSPLYLSRSRFTRKGKKQYLGEIALEEHCRKHGCRVVYPERLSLREQIVLFNSHDTFIGLNGSAFHTIMFRVVDRKATNIYLLDRAENSNFEIIDKLMDTSAHYIPCAVDAVGERVWKVDYDKAVEGLRAVLGWR